ncbi:MAG: HD domain-containing protein [Corynebacteriales bacterium]|nr:HD domain-containing protein [Mycobacteriales bacterium]
MTDSSAVGAVTYLYEVGVLKRSKRTGWWFADIASPESVADHSHRTAVIGAMLAVEEGADPARVALLCTFHDTQETRTGDIPHIGKRYVGRKVDNQGVTADQLAVTSPAVRDYFGAAVDEFERQETVEAVVARDADKLECLLQAVEYRSHGYQTDRWIKSSLGSLKTETARLWAETALEIDPQRWLVA